MWNAKTKQVLWALENRMRVSRGNGALLSGVHLMRDMGIQYTSDAADQLEGVLVCKQKQMDHMLMLDGALDRWTSDRISKQENKALLQALGLPPMKAPQRRLGPGGCASRSPSCTLVPLPL